MEEVSPTKVAVPVVDGSTSSVVVGAADADIRRHVETLGLPFF